MGLNSYGGGIDRPNHAVHPPHSRLNLALDVTLLAEPLTHRYNDPSFGGGSNFENERFARFEAPDFHREYALHELVKTHYPDDCESPRSRPDQRGDKKDSLPKILPPPHQGTLKLRTRRKNEND